MTLRANQGMSALMFAGIDPTGAIDSSAGFQAAVNLLAGTGIDLLIPAGTYKIAATVVLKSHLTIVGTPDTIIDGYITSGGGSTDAVFLAIWTATGVNTTLSATPQMGSNVVTCTSVSGYSVGDTVAIAVASVTYQTLFYTIIAINTGSKTLTLERPIRLPFSSGDAVTGVTNIPTEIHIKGNGMLFTGTSERYCEIAGALKCSIEDCRANTSLGAATTDYWFSFDVGGRYNAFRRMIVDMSLTTSVSGLVLESNEGSVIEDCTVTRAGAYNYLLLDCVDCEVRNCVGSLSASVSLALNGESGVRGCVNCRVIGGSHLSNAQYGVWVTSGALDCLIDGIDASFNTVTGIFFDGAGTGMRGNMATNCVVNANVYYGIRVQAGALDTILSSTRALNNAVGLSLLEDTLVDGLVAYGTYTPSGAPATSQQAIQTGSSAIVRASNVRITDTQNSTNFTMNIGAGTTLYLDDCQDFIGTNNYGIVVYGTIHLSNIKGSPYSGATGTHGLYLQSTGVAWIGEGCDWDATATPVTVVAGGAISRGTFVATGAVAVAVAFADIKSTSIVTLVRKTNGGTPGLTPLVTITAGTGFSATAIALDTSTYAYEIR